MGVFAKTVLALALAGAVASWIVGAIYFARALATTSQPFVGRGRWLAILGWPFALARIKGARLAEKSIVNKAIVAFFVLMTFAVTTISLATNFNRITK
jgi:hypothetical protein